MNNLMATGFVGLLGFTPSFLEDSLTYPGPADFGPEVHGNCQ